MRFQFTVDVEVERSEGKFASRDELEAMILEWLESANEGTLEGENGGQYEVTDYEVTAEPIKKKYGR